MIELAAAVNDRAVLESCLKRSPDILSGGARLSIYEGFASAGSAYNLAIEQSNSHHLVLLHQDVYLPTGFCARLAKQLQELNRIDSCWAVAGVIGIDHSGGLRGRTWSSGLGKLVGSQPGLPAAVQTLDELLLVVRLDSGVKFSPNLPGFHLFGTDIVQTAKLHGMNSYAIDLPVVHHSRPVVSLGGSYRAAYRHMQSKWRAQLPLPNLVCPIYASIVPLLWRDFRVRLRAHGRKRGEAPKEEPREVARRIGFEPIS